MSVEVGLLLVVAVKLSRGRTRAACVESKLRDLC